MTRWALLTLSIVVLAPAAHAAEADLTVELPAVTLTLPRVSPPHFQREGVPYASENELAIELLKLMDRQDYEGTLALAREKLGPMMAALETGDPAGLVARSAGPGRLPIPQTGREDVSATVLYVIGVAYIYLERWVPAEAALKAALVPLPDYQRVHEALGNLYIRTERWDEARAHLTRAAELGLNTASLHASLGYISYKTKNWWGMASAYQQALTMEPDVRDFRTALMTALNETRQYAAGLALVEQMLQSEPDDPVLWVYRSYMALNANDRALALTSLETAMRLGNDSVANKQVAAALHMERGSLARAVELLKSAPAEDLDFMFIDQALAWLNYQNEWDYFRDLLAAADARRALLDNLQGSRLLTHVSSLQLHDGNRRAAIATLQQAVDLDSSNAEALIVLGEAYRGERDLSRAELMFQRASAFDLYRENALVSLAQVAIDQQNFERALTLLRDVVSRNPARTDLQRNVDVLENLVLETTRD
ncbi:MAG TPA: tetratricopeptide repeat protein [Gammaproteobacteria bacterium]|nr:tetratricopeptide repeat protein [Gammaproteobacteria bacterium]